MTTQDLPLITADAVVTDLQANDKAGAIRALVDALAASGRVSDADGFFADVLAREGQMATGMPGGIGLPHAKSAHVVAPSLAIGRAPAGIDWSEEFGPATLIFLIAAPAGGAMDGGADTHLKILAALARRMMHAEFRDAISSAPDAQSIAAIITEQVVLP